MNISYRVFVNRLLKWSDGHSRPMPWKRTKDPYKIWLSEVILQQTQVRQGIPYYRKFVRRFPTVRHLARATENEVLHLWQGLGYNTRARHLHQAARTIVREHKNVFPDTYEDIRKLKGVGDYTAAAIASFAFGQSVPVLDSNVIRVLCRAFGIKDDPAKQQTRAVFLDILDRMIRHADPARFNQAIMNFGAMQCRPQNPDCTTCIFNKDCNAHTNGVVELLPARKKKPPKRKRFFHYIVIRDRDGLLIHHRLESDIWRQMFELPLIETRSARNLPATTREIFLQGLGVVPQSGLKKVHAENQVLTHQIVSCFFYDVLVSRVNTSSLPQDYRYVRINSLPELAYPVVVRTFLSGRFHTFNETQKLQ